MTDLLKGKILAITGGTGSFGETIARRALREGVAELRIFSRDENKQHHLRLALNDSRVRFHIGDVRQSDGLLDLLRGVDLLFHAAALKQVPSCEFHPLEAIRTNALGAENVLDAALAREVGAVVLLSTDKAVYPINAMGMSKALMEKLAIAKARRWPDGPTRICVTRYGNVMASRGSVIPHFVEQIRQGQALTLTDPRMTRFMMSLPDAAELVLEACARGGHGDILVQKAPAATVLDLAEALIEIFGGRTPLQNMGARHGEKLHETLVAHEEMARAADGDRYIRIPPDGRDLDYAGFFSDGGVMLDDADDFSSRNARRLDRAELIELLLGLDYIQAQLGASQPVQEPKA